MEIYDAKKEVAAREECLRRLEVLLNERPAERMTARAVDGEWSIAEIVEHLAIVDSQIIRLLQALLRKAEQAGSGATGTTRETSIDLIQARAGNEKYVTSEKFEPTGAVPLAESMKRLREIQSELTGILPRLSAVDPAGASFPHWIFGPLTLAQWLKFMPVHDERHVEQAEVLLAKRQEASG